MRHAAQDMENRATPKYDKRRNQKTGSATAF
jgi:hypothetical protein